MPVRSQPLRPRVDCGTGKTWGLEGSLFWDLIGGVFASVIILLVLFRMLH
ncbi:MAG: hypothetical protein QOE70_6210 [Chthoniobacter sp.]|jgi:hypothetical protein|nr:hypothetical protein [Chthoniobacter sp.]